MLSVARPSRHRSAARCGVPALAVAALAAAAAGTLAAGPEAAAAASPRPCPAATAQPGTVPAPALGRATICLVNRIRTARGMPALRPNRQLDAFASSYARRMVRGGFFAHDVPRGPTFRQRVAASAYARAARRMSMGENLAWAAGGLASPAQIVTSWMRSPGHRANILRRDFRDIGVGVAPAAPERGWEGFGPATYVHAFGVRTAR